MLLFCSCFRRVSVLLVLGLEEEPVASRGETERLCLHLNALEDHHDALSRAVLDAVVVQGARGTSLPERLQGLHGHVDRAMEPGFPEEATQLEREELADDFTGAAVPELSELIRNVGWTSCSSFLVFGFTFRSSLSSVMLTWASEISPSGSWMSSYVPSANEVVSI